MKNTDLMIVLTDYLGADYVPSKDYRRFCFNKYYFNAIGLKNKGFWKKFFMGETKTVAWIENPLSDGVSEVNELIIHCHDVTQDHQSILENKLSSFEKDTGLPVKFLPNYERLLHTEFNKVNLLNKFVDSSNGLWTYGINIVDSHYVVSKDTDETVGVFLSESPWARFQLNYTVLDYSSMDLLITNNKYEQIFNDVFKKLDKAGFEGRVLNSEDVSNNSDFRERLIKYNSLLKKIDVKGLVLPEKPYLHFMNFA